jgi:hypothetical protein
VLVEQIPAGVQARLRLKTTSFVSTLPRAWHGAHDLSSAFLTAVGYVIDLATRNKDADFHERFASGALRRMGFKALKPFPVFELRPHLRHRNPQHTHSLVGRSVSPRAAERSLLPTLAWSGKAVHE